MPAPIVHACPYCIPILRLIRLTRFSTSSNLDVTRSIVAFKAFIRAAYSSTPIGSLRGSSGSSSSAISSVADSNLASRRLRIDDRIICDSYNEFRFKLSSSNGDSISDCTTSSMG